MLDYKYIEQLLERYWQCETTLEEEQILHSFFSQGNVPAHLNQYAELFAYENQSKAECLDDSFKQKMMDMVEEEPAVEAKVITLTQRFAPVMKAAAVVAVALTIGNVAERAMRENSVKDASGAPVVADTYTRTDDIMATIKVIDQNQSAAMAKADSVKTMQVIDDQSEIME